MVNVKKTKLAFEYKVIHKRDESNTKGFIHLF